MKKHSALLGTLLIVTAIIVVVNYLVGGLNFLNLRMDMTEKKIYTLSEGTRRTLLNIPAEKTPVTLRFYASRDGRVMPQMLDGYARTVQDLLLEFEKASDGKIVIEKIDPRPDTEDEDKAREDDIAGNVGNAKGERFYIGLAISSLDKKEVIPALSPNTESALEYDITRAIAKVTNPKKPVIGIMTPMPIAGPAMSQQMMMMMRQQQQQPWAVVQQLRADYDVKNVPMTADKIDSDINILIVIHPADIQEKTEFALDQFLLRGGKLVAFVDSQCAVTNVYNQQGNPMMGQPPSMTLPNSTMPNLFKAWGIGFDKEMVVADMAYRTGFQGRALPTFLSIPREGINRNEPFTAPLEVLQMFSPGAFTVEKKDGISETTLLESSEKSMLIDNATAEKLRREPLNSFQSSGRKQILGLRLTGHFKSAFPDGAPKDKSPEEKLSKLPGGTGGANEDAGAPKPVDKPADKPAAAATAPAPAPATPAPAAGEPARPAANPTPAPVTATTPPVSAPAAPAPATSQPVAPAKTAEGKPADAKAPEAPKANWLKDSVNNDGIVFHFSDADMLFDGFCFQQDPLGRLMALNHNVFLLQNLVELLNGGSDLINVRSRGSTKRSFSKLEELRNEVEKDFRPTIESLEKKREEAIKEISSLKVTTDKEGNQMIILDPQKKQQLVRLQESEAQIMKELREVKKKQNARVDRQEMFITVLNLLGVPLLIIIFGIVLAMRRRSLQAAK